MNDGVMAILMAPVTKKTRTGGRLKNFAGPNYSDKRSFKEESFVFISTKNWGGGQVPLPPSGTQVPPGPEKTTYTLNFCDYDS